MNDEKKDFEWNPPTPPWQSEPEPLSLRATLDKEKVVEEASKESGDAMPIIEVPEPEPVNMGLEGMVEKMVEDGDLKLVEAPGLTDYTVKCQTGITVNGKLFEAGTHSVDESTYETLSILDAPFQ